MSDFSRHGIVAAAPDHAILGDRRDQDDLHHVALRQPRERIVADAHDGPFIQQDAAERFVEFDRRRVPVEHRPLQARPAVLDAFACKMNHQRLADALAAMLRPHEQVFEINAGTPAEGGEIQEPEREADRLAVPLGEVAEDARLFAEQRLVDIGLGRHRLVDELFVFGKFAHELEHERGLALVRAGGSKASAHTATSALMCGCGS